MTKPRILSFGAGVQSHALLALLGQGRYPGAPPDEAWFCDPKGERPGTYEFLERVTKPYCAARGIPLLTLERLPSGKVLSDLLEDYRRRKQYPLRQNRQCTVDWKIDVMLKECKRRGWNKVGGVEKHIGISMDEMHRAHSGKEEDWEVKRYPLLEARMYRDQCAALCRQEFGEVPVKSGCWFCKYQNRQQWREVWEERADGRWDRAVQWEADVLAAHAGRSAYTFISTRKIGVRNRTLPQWAEVWAEGAQMAFPDMEPEGACDGGYCMT